METFLIILLAILILKVSYYHNHGRNENSETKYLEDNYIGRQVMFCFCENESDDSYYGKNLRMHIRSLFKKPSFGNGQDKYTWVCNRCGANHIGGAGIQDTY